MNTHVFETFMGLPLHPLVIHAAVVLIPILVLVALCYALVPRLRDRIGWLAVLMAVIAPLSALGAKITGDAFRARLARINPNGALLVLVMVLVRRRPPILNVLLIVAVIAASGVTAYYVYRTGDSAARIVWKGY